MRLAGDGREAGAAQVEVVAHSGHRGSWHGLFSYEEEKKSGGSVVFGTPKKQPTRGHVAPRATSGHVLFFSRRVPPPTIRDLWCDSAAQLYQIVCVE